MQRKTEQFSDEILGEVMTKVIDNRRVTPVNLKILPSPKSGLK